jgi:hypothetical protein
MEYLRGLDLATVCSTTRGRCPVPCACSTSRCQVLAALGEAHHSRSSTAISSPRTSSSVEPTRSGGDFVKVVDFGLAKIRVDSGPSITSPGIVCGTPDYMAPEQGARRRARREEPTSTRSASSSSSCSPARSRSRPSRPRRSCSCTSRRSLKTRGTSRPSERSPTPSSTSRLKRARESRPTNATRTPTPSPTPSPAPSRRTRTADDASALAGRFVCGTCGAMNPDEAEVLRRVRHSHPSACRRTTLRHPPSRSRAASSEGAKRARRSSRSRSSRAAASRAAKKTSRGSPIAARGRKSSLVGARVVGEPGLGKTRLLARVPRARSGRSDTSCSRRAPTRSAAEVGYFAIAQGDRRASRACPTRRRRPPRIGRPPPRLAAVQASASRRALFASRGVERARRGRCPTSTRRFVIAEALRWAIVERASERAAARRSFWRVDDLQPRRRRQPRGARRRR